jgi:hypothetical protein
MKLLGGFKQKEETKSIIHVDPWFGANIRKSKYLKISNAK